jgi:hypothetical protein
MRRVFAFSIPLSLCSPALPQGGPSPETLPAREAPAPPRFSMLGGYGPQEPFLSFDEPGDGTLWVRGERYKAGFDTEGRTFIPFLGGHAPRNFPLRFTLESVSRGDVALPVAERVAPRREGNRIVFDRGGIQERYECTPEGIEQVFVVEGAAGAGDLVVRMRVETDLTYAGIGEEGVAFSAEGLGEVRYGGAVAFDEGGSSVEAIRSFDGSAIELRVPSAFVAAATGAVTIDPLISVFCISCSTTDHFNPDASYDETTDRFLVVFEKPFSAMDHDIYSLELDTNGAVVPGSGTFVEVGPGDWRNPRVANNNAANRHLVVAEAGGAIWGRLRNAGSTSMLSPFSIWTGYPGCTGDSPDVGGDPSPTGATLFLVVWRTLGTTIARAMVDSAGAVVLPYGGCFSLPFGVSGPSISKSNGGDLWAIVWSQAGSSPVDYDVRGILVDTAGNNATVPFYVDISLNDDRPAAVSSPDAAGRFLITWERTVAVTGEKTICARVFEDWWVGLTPTIDLVSLAGAGITGPYHFLPSADSDGCGFTVAFLEWSASVPDVYPATFHYSPVGTIGLTEPTVTGLAGGPWIEGPPRIVSKWSGGGTGPRHLMVWDSTIPSMGPDISGAIFDSLPSPCVPTGVDCPLFSADFEGTGLAPYSEMGSGPLPVPVPTLWHAEGFCDVGVPIPPSMGVKAAAYNLGDAGIYNYDTGGANSGSLQSPFIGSTAGADLFLTFDYLRETEGGATFDQSFVEVRPAGGAWSLASQILDQRACSTPIHVAVEIPIAGGNWQHRFRFSTGDGVLNGFRGWYVDNVVAYQVASSGGSFATDPTGCGGPVLVPTGIPVIGGTVVYSLYGTTGTPVIWIGDPTSSPLCPPAPCALGATLGIVVPGSAISGIIPCQPGLIGGVFSVQGADLGATGGCGAGAFGIPFTVSHTIDTTIG